MMRSKLVEAAGILGMTAALLCAGNDEALAGKSHLGQKPERHVTLKWTYLPGATGCTTDYGFVELSADGSQSASEYVLPEGYALVATDVDWLVNGPFFSNWLAQIELSYSGVSFPRAFSRGEFTNAEMIATELWQGSASMTTGFEWKGATKLCASTAQVRSSGFVANLSVRSLTVRGYLIKSR